MNYSIVFYIIGWVLKFEAYFLTLPFFVGLIYKEQKCYAYIVVAVLCYLLGFLLTRKKPVNGNLYTHDGFISVAMSWILLSMFGALPFVITGDIPSYVDALFETVSGFTTTGASILTDVEALSHSGLFWRSFSHWIGGMGVFVFIMAILPLMGGSTMNLMKAESPGPSVERLVPHVKDTAKILYGIYIFITVAEILLLWAFHMPIFEAVTTSCGTVGTGGFGVKNDSLCSYSPALQNIVTIFMILSGINYIAYFYVITRKFRKLFHMEEVRAYIIIIVIAAIIISLNIRNYYGTFGESLRHSFFQVGSIITTTGFCTENFDLWPQLSKTILVLLMFVGACAGSTGGGIKVSRILILFKTIRKEIAMIIHPRAVRKVRIENKAVPHEVVRTTNVFIAVYFTILFGSLLLLGLNNMDFTTNFTATVATLNNIGPGLEMVGPVQNYSIFSNFSKFVLIFDMLAGRLELFPMLILFSPSSWKRN